MLAKQAVALFAGRRNRSSSFRHEMSEQLRDVRREHARTTAQSTWTCATGRHEYQSLV